MHTPVISVNNLLKSYGKARGIKDVSFEVNEGEIFGFIGPNGAGKSTTIRILMNLIWPDKGNAMILGHDVTRDKEYIMEHVGYVPADANAYNSMKVLDFLKFCGNFYKSYSPDDRIRTLCERFELDLNRKISNLSFGNRKKVSIVQSLLHRPRLLILDEPTTGLDPIMQSRFFDLLQSENTNGMTVFFSSHLLNEVQRLCKKVAIIKDGSILSIEEIESLRKKQLKRITIGFERSSDAEKFDIQGMESILTREKQSVSFMFSGNINDLNGKLSVIPLKDLIIEEPALEEIFIHYYK